MLSLKLYQKTFHVIYSNIIEYILKETFKLTKGLGDVKIYSHNAVESTNICLPDGLCQLNLQMN